MKLVSLAATAVPGDADGEGEEDEEAGGVPGDGEEAGGGEAGGDEAGGDEAEGDEADGEAEGGDDGDDEGAGEGEPTVWWPATRCPEGILTAPMCTRVRVPIGGRGGGSLGAGFPLMLPAGG